MSAKKDRIAVVVGSSGGIGSAMMTLLKDDDRFTRIVGLSRNGPNPLELTDERSIGDAAQGLADCRGKIVLFINAAGFLHDTENEPEKTYRSISQHSMTKSFATNAIGPALLMREFLPLLSKSERSVFASLSARVGSIEDNELGGWYSNRASKAALNQLVRTSAIEMKRINPMAVCVALHPGTVLTRLSAPFAKTGLDVQDAATAAARLLNVIDKLQVGDSGKFLDNRGAEIAW